MIARYALTIAALFAFVLTGMSGLIVVPFLHKLHYGQTIKEIGPTWHKNKQGTPTMGGICFIFGSTLGLGLAWLYLSMKQSDLLGSHEAFNVVLALSAAWLFGLVGFVDDYIKVVKKRNLGLKVMQKIVLQVAITLLFMYGLHLNGVLTSAVVLPIVGFVDLGILFYPIAFLLIIFMVNAVNLTDGIDGLASSVTFVVMLAYVIAAGVLNYFHLAVYAAAVAGGCAGFLLWNFHPAKVFMGDTGSMYLGGAVTALAFCMSRPELLLFFGFIYICEAGSVVIQVSYFKATHGKRIFKMTPIHHSFEMDGWSEEAQRQNAVKKRPQAGRGTSDACTDKQKTHGKAQAPNAELLLPQSGQTGRCAAFECADSGGVRAGNAVQRQLRHGLLL